MRTTPTTWLPQHLYFSEISLSPRSIFHLRDSRSVNLIMSSLILSLQHPLMLDSHIWNLALLLTTSLPTFGNESSPVDFFLNFSWTSILTNCFLSMLVPCPASDCWFPQTLGFSAGAQQQIYRLTSHYFHSSSLSQLIYPNCQHHSNQLTQIVRTMYRAIEITQNGAIPSKFILSFLSISTPPPKPMYGMVAM